MSEARDDREFCFPQDGQNVMSIHTRKITDACRDKDCIEDLRVYLTRGSQAIVNTASNVRVRCADLISASIDVEPVAFDRNHYCVDVTFFYRILADAVVGNNRPVPLTGLAVFSKRVVLCGEDSKAHIFTSDTRIGALDGPTQRQDNRPIAVVEVLDPMVLGSKVTEACEHGAGEVVPQLSAEVQEMFDEDLVTTFEGRRLLVTLGQFSIIRLERDAQFVVPVLDSCIPTKVCCDTPGCAEDPCELFSRIPFPSQQFSPTGCPVPETVNLNCHNA